jgi:hypothetical protein
MKIVRRGWRALAIGGIGALIVLGSASAAPTTTFVSKQYRYSVVLPGSSGLWHQSAAGMSWTQGTLEPGVPQFDTLTDARTARFFIIGERRLPTGSTLKAWTSYFLSAQALDCTRKSPISATTLGGRPANSFEFSCSDGVVGMGVDAVHGQGGYFMVFSSWNGSLDAPYRSEFDAVRSSFHFSGS